MIQLNRNFNVPEKADEDIPIKIVGVGGAGTNVLDRIVLDGFDKADLIAINTDVQSLASSVAASKVQLGRTVTRGLGAGGDPEVGYNAAYESADEIRHALTDARMIFVCAGLGGGTGSRVLVKGLLRVLIARRRQRRRCRARRRSVRRGLRCPDERLLGSVDHAEATRRGDDRGRRRPARDVLAQAFVAKLLVGALLREPIQGERRLGANHTEPDQCEQ